MRRCGTIRRHRAGPDPVPCDGRLRCSPEGECSTKAGSSTFGDDPVDTISCLDAYGFLSYTKVIHLQAPLSCGPVSLESVFLMISIIIRTRNEERWITSCLRAILDQTVADRVEIVLVDNQSTDRTIDRARQDCPNLKLVEVQEFRPGLAINEGIRAASGDYLVCLSAHCPPATNSWLEALQSNADDPNVAGVYGRQLPVEFTTPSDKRDLLLTFGLDRKVQKRDSFFHNANSMIRRDIWERFPFDESVTNIEDRLWGRDVIAAGLTIVYEPDAAVYHHHGIHQDNDRERCENVVRIMEDLMPEAKPDRTDPLDPARLAITALLPLRMHGDESVDFSDWLIQRTLENVRQSRYINRLIVCADSEELQQKVIDWGAEAPFLRPKSLSAPDVRVDEVLQYTLERLEEAGEFSDLLVPLEVTHPFRPHGLLDGLVDQLLRQGLDTVIAGIPESRPCWMRRPDGQLAPLMDYDVPRSRREPVHVALPSLGCATYPQFVRGGRRLGDRIGIFELHDPLADLEIRTAEDLRRIESQLNRQIAGVI